MDAGFANIAAERSEQSDSGCSYRRSAGGTGGTALFRFASSDEDGGNQAKIAASEASNQIQPL